MVGAEAADEAPTAVATAGEAGAAVAEADEVDGRLLQPASWRR